jgi:hypothetical protein
MVLFPTFLTSALLLITSWNVVYVHSTTILSSSTTTTITSHDHHHSSRQPYNPQQYKRQVSRISEDEDGSRHTQLTLDPLLICLYPTVMALDGLMLQHDLRIAMKDLVSTKLQQEYTDTFEYFDFTDAKNIVWYSGQEEEKEAAAATGNSDNQIQLGKNEKPVPCTCAWYPGAVVLMTPSLSSSSSSPPEGDNDNTELLLYTPSILQPKIAAILEAGLVPVLQNVATTITDDDDDDSFNTDSTATTVTTTTTNTPSAYFELEAALVSWNVTMGGNDDEDDDGSGDDLVMPPKPGNENESSSGSPSMSPHDPINIPVVVPGLENENSWQTSSPNGFMEQYGMAVIMIMVVILLLILTCALLSYLPCVRRYCCYYCCYCCCSCCCHHDDAVVVDNDNHPTNMHKTTANADTATVNGEQDEDEEEGRRQRRGHKSHKSRYSSSNSSVATGDDTASAQTGDVSEMAQYRQGELMECISVASEWTMGTNEDTMSLDRSSITGPSPRMLVSAELFAAKESFERDRKQVTLQKDMLHSAWSAACISGMVDTTAATATAANQMTTGESNTLSFTQAYQGQGEEVYLMPPRSSRMLVRS